MVSIAIRTLSAKLSQPTYPVLSVRAILCPIFLSYIFLHPSHVIHARGVLPLNVRSWRKKHNYYKKKVAPKLVVDPQNIF